MSFDERATNAGAAISNRAGALTPHRSGLIRKRWVAPVGVMVLIVVALGAASLVGIGRGTTSRVETVAGIDGEILVVDGVDDRLLGGFVSADGAVTILSGDPASPTLQRLRLAGPPPILDVPTIPKPRWAFGGRVIEYVTQAADGAEAVSVDVPTGRISTKPYSVPELTSRGIAGLLESDFSHPLMRASSLPSVIAVGEGSEAMWWVRRVSGDRGRLYDIDSIEFLAPGLDSLIVISEDSLSLIDAGRDIQSYAPEGVADVAVRSATVGLSGETAFGLTDATVVVETNDGVVSFEVGEQFGEVSEMAWDPTDASVFVHTLAAESRGEALHQCVIAEGVCSRVGVDVAGSLVRGSPQTLPSHDVLNIWPGEAVSSDPVGDAPWRLDPTLLVTQFAVTVFGWADPLVMESERLAQHQQQVAFDLGIVAGDLSFSVTVSQTDGQVGWFVSKVLNWSDSPGLRFEMPFDGIATLEFRRQEAAVVEVTLNVEGIEVSGRATEGDEIELDFGEYRFDPGGIKPYSGFPDNVGFFFILFRDQEGMVFQAVSSALVPGQGEGQPFG